MTESYRSTTAARLAGCSYRQLDFWDRTGLVRPSISEARGSGTQRRYSWGDVVLLAIVVQLLNNGMSLQRARRAIDAIRNVEDLYGVNLVFLGSDIRVATTTGSTIDAVMSGVGIVAMLNVGAVAAELRQRIPTPELVSA